MSRTPWEISSALAPGEAKIGRGHGRLVVEQGAQGVLLGAEFQARQVAEPHDRAVRVALDDDLSELLGALQAALDVDRQLNLNAFVIGRAADLAGGDLDVLAAHRVQHLVGGQILLGDLVRVEPQAHGVVARAEQAHLADPAHPGQLVLDVQGRVVAQVEHVVAFAGRAQMHHHGQVRRALDRGDAELADHVGQARQGLGDPVFDLLLGQVRIGADLEGHGQRHVAVGRGQRVHVEHALDAVDLLFERRCHGLGDDRRVGARELGLDHDRRRRHLGVLRDRQIDHGGQAGDEDQHRQDAGKDRAIDEESRERHGDDP